MYVCSCCEAVSRPREPRKTFAALRDDGSIAAEKPVCPPCFVQLDAGMPWSIVRRQRRRVESPAPIPVEPVRSFVPPPTPVVLVERDGAPPEIVPAPVEPGVEVELLGVRVNLPTTMTTRRGKTKKQRKEAAKKGS